DYSSSIDVPTLKKNCYEAMNDDLNSPILIAHLFDAVKMVNSIHDNKATVSEADLNELKLIFHNFVFEILGLKDEETGAADNSEVLTQVVDLLLNLRIQAKANKDWATADRIRNELNQIGFEIKDRKDGFEWELKK
ncbi:MAG: cysteine--tRNA ligase, partial [Bacteroidota bacterium]|nr:cysteine--tRNA ligase [Bacteroidota bacterium]